MEKDKLNKMDEEVKAEMVGILEPMLSHVPFKPATRMKSVSKTWFRLISSTHQTINRTTSSRLLCQHLCPEYDSKDNFNTTVTVLDVTVQPQGELELLKYSPSLSLAKDFLFLGSSGGSLVCCSKKMNEIHICNLASYKWLSVPTMGSNDYYGDFLIGLSVNSLPSYNYNVICASLKRKDIIGRGLIECKIFSAETGKWREHRTRLVNFSLMDEVFPYNYNVYIPYLYTHGVIHWLLDECLLMYHTEYDFFKVMELPMNTKDSEFRVNRCCWGSAGRLHYSNCNKERLSVWTYDGDDLYECVEGFRNNWKLKHRVELGPLKENHPEIFGTIPGKIRRFEMTNPFVQPCGFDEDLQIMYLHIPGMILSYNFDTRRLGKVWSYKLRDPIPNGVLQNVLLRLCLCFPVQFSDTELPLKDNCLSLQLREN